MPEIPEPGDRAIVMWANGGAAPVAVYVRLDNYVEPDGDELARWFNADELRVNDGPWRWALLCERKNGWAGPYLLNVGELLGGTE